MAAKSQVKEGWLKVADVIKANQAKAKPGISDKITRIEALLKDKK